MDQLIFSSAVPGFYLLFPCNGGNCVLCGFNINQLCYIIFCRKAIGVCVGLMLPNSALQVTGYASVKGHIGGACQDVYIVHAVFPPILSLRSQCAHWLWQSVLPVLGAGILRIPTTSLRTGLGMTRKFFWLLSLRAGAHTGYPARNPSTGLRPVSLPLGKGGYLSPYYSVPSPSDFLLRRFG